MWRALSTGHGKIEHPARDLRRDRTDCAAVRDIGGGRLVRLARLDRCERTADAGCRLCRHDARCRILACGRLRPDGAVVLFEPSRLRRPVQAERPRMTLLSKTACLSSL